MDSESPSGLLSAFAESHVVAITGLSRHQLRAWDCEGLVQPDFASEDRRDAFSRVYSFQDLVGLKTIAVLQKQFKISTRKLKTVARSLVARGFSECYRLKLYVVKGEVHFVNPDGDAVEGVETGQFAMLPIIDVINDVTEKVEELKRRSPDDIGRFQKSRHVLRNAQVVRGTRIPVRSIQSFARAGYSADDILREYPSLSLEDIERALSSEEGLARGA
jgi:DNA-binding transcriptional MerR regulator